MHSAVLTSFSSAVEILLQLPRTKMQTGSEVPREYRKGGQFSLIAKVAQGQEKV